VESPGVEAVSGEKILLCTTEPEFDRLLLHYSLNHCLCLGLSKDTWLRGRVHYPFYMKVCAILKGSDLLKVAWGMWMEV
jgi:hypothetical protein